MFYKLHAQVGSFDSVQSFDFTTLYTTLPLNLIKQKFAYLMKWSFNKLGCEYLFELFLIILGTKKVKTALIGLHLIWLPDF